MKNIQITTKVLIRMDLGEAWTVYMQLYLRSGAPLPRAANTQIYIDGMLVESNT
jgi:hypothetical protein